MFLSILTKSRTVYYDKTNSVKLTPVTYQLLYNELSQSHRHITKVLKVKLKYKTEYEHCVIYYHKEKDELYTITTNAPNEEIGLPMIECVDSFVDENNEFSTYINRLKYDTTIGTFLSIINCLR